MSIQIFTPRNVDGSPINVPMGYRRKVKWLPQIGDIFPNFKVATTQGDLNFWDWAEGSYTFLFSHPAAKTPVCTTEIAALARAEACFERLETNVLALTGSSMQEQLEWHDDIRQDFQARVWFPGAEDKGGHLAKLFGMRHEKEHATWPIRKSFILDPQMRVRMIFEYPVFIGRCVDETLRVITALQLHDRTGFATPGDWYEGDAVIVPEDIPEAQVLRELGVQSRQVSPYLRVAQPNSKPANIFTELSPSRHMPDPSPESEIIVEMRQQLTAPEAEDGR
ncbi:peroxiredoxin [Roseovarius sp. A46]|uniref:peroxiredoxin n=1 Tax=Roseovarius sp. A46 TaxID=2109331 RepID=UPI00101260EC|nr:redoxin domain-containing protein [Roseovarius sp. A46]RXV58061.1 peroxiredoxin [Roseovarius sp. A46]